MATTTKKRIQIAETLYGIPEKRADELTAMVHDIMDNHAVDEKTDHDKSPQAVADHWRIMYSDAVINGVTENERLWITFQFAMRYQDYINRYTAHKNLQKLIKSLLK